MGFVQVLGKLEKTVIFKVDLHYGPCELSDFFEECLGSSVTC